jgi:hypothetical protein
MYQNDDYGKDYLRGLKDGLGSKADSMIIATESYETSEPTIDSHIVNLKASGANVFFDVAIPKFAAQAIREVADLKWKPVHFLNNVSASISATIKPAGVENSQGIISSIWLKDPTDPQWKDDPDIKAWNAFLDKYYPEANRSDGNVIYGYAVAQAVVHVLGQRGDNLTRENIMKQAASLRDYTVAGLLPGIKNQHQRDRFCAGFADATDAVQGRHLGAIWKDPEWKSRELTIQIANSRPRQRPGASFERRHPTRQSRLLAHSGKIQRSSSSMCGQVDVDDHWPAPMALRYARHHSAFRRHRYRRAPCRFSRRRVGGPCRPTSSCRRRA